MSFGASFVSFLVSRRRPVIKVIQDTVLDDASLSDKLRRHHHALTGAPFGCFCTHEHNGCSHLWGTAVVKQKHWKAAAVGRQMVHDVMVSHTPSHGDPHTTWHHPGPQRSMHLMVVTLNHWTQSSMYSTHPDTTDLIHLTTGWCFSPKCHKPIN